MECQTSLFRVTLDGGLKGSAEEIENWFMFVHRKDALVRIFTRYYIHLSVFCSSVCSFLFACLLLPAFLPPSLQLSLSSFLPCLPSFLPSFLDSFLPPFSLQLSPFLPSSLPPSFLSPNLIELSTHEGPPFLCTFLSTVKQYIATHCPHQSSQSAA